MKREEFRKKYPEGMNELVYVFKKCLGSVINGGEIDKLINYAESASERKALIKIRDNMKGSDFVELPILPLLNEMKSADLFRDVFCLMVDKIDRKVTAEDIHED